MIPHLHNFKQYILVRNSTAQTGKWKDLAKLLWVRNPNCVPPWSLPGIAKLDGISAPRENPVARSAGPSPT